MAAVETIYRHSRGRSECRHALGRIGYHEWSVVHAIESRPQVFTNEESLGIRGVDVPADVNVRRHRRIAATQCATNHRSDTRSLDPHRKQVAGHGVMLRLEMNGPEFGVVGEAAQKGALIHHRGDGLQSLSQENSVGGCGDLRASTQQFTALHARSKRRVLLRIPEVGLRHASGEPNQDHGVRLRGERGFRSRLRLGSTGGPRVKPGGRGSSNGASLKELSAVQSSVHGAE